MTTTSEVKRTATREAPPEVGRAKPVIMWAVFGAACLAFEAYLIISWLLSGPKPPPPGPTPMPTFMAITIYTWLPLGFVALAAFFYYILYRPWRREGRISTDGLFSIVFATIWWQDALALWSSPYFTYNLHIPNLGNWMSGFPGALTPDVGKICEPVLWHGPIYIWGVFGLTIVVNKVMRKVKERWAHISNLALIGIVFVCFVFFILLLEPLLMYLGFYNYGGGVKALSIFQGHYYQMPVYEAVCWGACWTGWTALRFFKNDKGETVAERGIDEVQASGRTKTVLRLLALVGICNAIFFAGYNIPQTLINLNGGPFPQEVIDKSYFIGDLCGPGTTYACPGPNVPVPKQHSAHVAPDGSLVPAH